MRAGQQLLRPRGVALLAFALIVACNNQANPGVADAARDGSNSDASPPDALAGDAQGLDTSIDTRLDVTLETSVVDVRDAAVDAHEAAIDAPPDAATDATPEAATDATPEAGEDATEPADASHDTTDASAMDGATDAFDMDAPTLDGSFDGGATDTTDSARDVSSDAPDTAMMTFTSVCSPSCATGYTCCPRGLLGECRMIPDGGACPLPDLTVDADEARARSSLDWEYFEADSCAIQEACVVAPGWRRLLRFPTVTPNVGTADMVLGNPAGDPRFVYSACHDHYHFEGYATYALLDGEGRIVARGHKQSFCLLDSNRWDSSASPFATYSCSFQGISVGWEDEYGPGLDCQWVDVTDVPEGNYTLEIAINPFHLLPEASYDNNIVRVPVRIRVDHDPTLPCEEGDTLEGPPRSCGWNAEPTPRTCTPGTAVRVGCGVCATGSACSGDAVIRICEGATHCSMLMSLAADDDSCGGSCPLASFTCPDSGRYTVMTASYDTMPASCAPVVF